MTRHALNNMHKKLPTKRQLEHWLFDKRPENVDKSPLRKVSPEGLKRFLDLSGVNHQAGYYQYSNETALSGIFENSTLHLSLGRRMNDKVEFRNCNPERWGRTYVASFSFGTSEQIGMWAVYGRPPGNAVRIAFPKTAMLSIREAWRTCGSRSGREKPKEGIPIVRFPCQPALKKFLSMTSSINTDAKVCRRMVPSAREQFSGTGEWVWQAVALPLRTARVVRRLPHTSRMSCGPGRTRSGLSSHWTGRCLSPER